MEADRRLARARWRALTPAIAAMLALAAAACSSGGGAPPSTAAGTATAAASATMTSPGATASAAAASATATSAAPTPTPAPSTAAPAAPPTPPAGPARLVYRGNPERRMVALTFDAGSDAGFTAEILDTLRREGIRASFSVTGLWAERNRDLLLAIAADGHMFINHSYDHASFTGLLTQRPPLTAEERALELSRTETTVYHLTQRTTRPYFRPPYGDIDPDVLRDVAADGYDTVLMWTVDSLGWDRAPADAIVERCLSLAAPGAIYVMHVGSESQDAAALPRVIAGLRAAGYAFGTVDDVLR